MEIQELTQEEMETLKGGIWIIKDGEWIWVESLKLPNAPTK